MSNISNHMRICAANISDSDVNSRQAAVATLASSWKKDKTAPSIIATAADIAESLGGDGSPSSRLGEKVQKAIQSKSSSYLYEERPLDVGVCAGMAVISVIGTDHSVNGWTVSDVYAIALWSALSYQPVLDADRRENLRREVLNKACSWSIESANQARKRSDVPEPADVKISIDENNVVDSNFNEAIANTIDALRRNAALDREELDFLWWAQLGRSRLLKKQFSEISEPTRIVAAGIEGAKILHRLPCEVHREIVLRTLDRNPELNMEELLLAIGDDREVLRSVLNSEHILNFPVVFPLLHSLYTGEPAVPGSSVKRPVSEWGERALLEATFLKMMLKGPSKI